MSAHHQELVKEMEKVAGKPVRDPFLENYLGHQHPLYRINSASLKKMARAWMSANKEMPAEEFVLVIKRLVTGKTFTEKILAGLLLNVARPLQRSFDPVWLDRWLMHLVGWCEVDTLCTGRYPEIEVPRQWTAWKKLLAKFSRSEYIQKRRASIVLLCSPLRRNPDPRLLQQALKNVDRLCHEKEVLITKAVSWVLRSASVHYPREIKKYVTSNEKRLPRIAVRETLTKITTGTKTKRKAK